MERPGDSQVTAAEAREIRGAFRDLTVTLRDVFGPPSVTLKRRSETSGNFATVATFTPEAIVLPKRQEAVSGANAGMVRVTNAGQMTVAATLDIRRDDRFLLDGRWATVTDVAPEVNAIGYVPVDFTLEG